MKINRFLGLAAIALLVVGVMSLWAARSFAQTDTLPAAQATPYAADVADANDGADTEAEIADSSGADAECQDAQDNGGQDAETQDGETQDTESQDAAPAGSQPAITAEQAQKIAEDYLNAGSASAVELDNENGKLVYGVEFNGTDVKVDANTGEVLGVETGQD